MNRADALRQAVEQFRIHHCLDCGKCTGACPPAQVDSGFSPRLFARRVMDFGLDSDDVREKVWTCLTCNLCVDRCPSGIEFSRFIQVIRSLYVREGQGGRQSHGGTLHALMRMQAAPAIKQNRTRWITPDMETAETGDVLFLAGCVPYFHIYFRELGLDLIDIPRSAVRLLNAMNIRPVVLENERCCGHDLYWSGEMDAFERLRDRNLDAFHKAGARTIVTACAECAYCLKTLYGGESGFTVRHLTELLAEHPLPVEKRLDETAVFQDPCRLARFQGVVDPPREILNKLVDLREMAHRRNGAWCCGNSAWINCNRFSKQMQIQRLMEARAAGARTIVTACPKCRVHLACALRDPNVLIPFNFQIKDVASLAWAAVSRSKSPERPDHDD